MILKKLEIYGFKSFADKTEILFTTGITDIVGPNGCGKSNVADSIRWVLGEQSAKTLRGDNMQDVIFSGTEMRKSVSYCEVSLFFDNTDRSVTLPYDEIILTRKLYRSGESEYYINRSQCRLKDITELIREAQIGREGYSIIGQGKVDEFINSKPEDRRALFDEATGIASTKVKKVEAERKLQRTKDNLYRYKDIILEIERQLEPMREQAETAKKYLKFKDELKIQEVNSYIYKKDSVDEQKSKLTEKIKALSEELKLRQTEYDEIDEKYNAILEELSSIDESITGIRNKQLDLVIKREKTESEGRLNEQRISFLSEQNRDSEKEVVFSRGEIERLKNELSTASERLDKQSCEQKTASTDLKARENDLITLEEKSAKIRAKIDEIKNKVSDDSEKHSEALRKIAVLEASIDGLEQTKISVSARKERFSGEYVSLREQIDKLDAEKSSIDNELVRLNSDLSALQTKIATTESTIKEINEETISLANENTSRSSKLKYLRQIKDNYEGFSQPVKKLLLDAKNDTALSSKIEGVVANVISVPKELETAVEAALGASIQNVITNNFEDTKYLISYLKEKRHGVVTFLPIPLVKPRVLTRENSECLKMSGVLGVASDLIQYNAKYTGVFKSLLGATVIVENIDVGRSVAKAFDSAFKIVTKEGEIFGTSGSISGGSYRGTISNILSYDREIQECESRISEIKARTEKNNLEKGALLIKAAGLNDDEKALQAKISEASLSLAKISGKSLELASTEARVKSDKANIDAEATALAERIDEISAELCSLRASEGEFESVSVNMTEELDSLRAARSAVDERISAANADKNTLMVTNARLSIELDNIKAQKSALEKSIYDLERTVANKLLNIGTNKEIIEECQKRIFTASSDDTVEIDKISEQLSSLDSYRKSQNESMKSIDKSRTGLMMELQKISSKKSVLELELDKYDMDLQNMQEKISDEYGLSYEQALEFKQDKFSLYQSQIAIKKLKEQIINLGNVNVNAIEDIRALSERYSEMTKQCEDMEKAREDLSKVISEINAEMKLKFNEGFKQINEYFDITFKELFGGGRARLKLAEGEDTDLLTCGIDIEAEPPGKNLQNLNLLSGGEKALTAIAIIISIIKLRPMPFCIFDEIESALDEINTVRFAKYIKRFSSESQFILITHKRATMEVADKLYGVTMQEKGVSKLVSVKLKDVV